MLIWEGLEGKLSAKIDELRTKGLSIGDLKKEIKAAEDDIEALGKRTFLLSWLGAVIAPSTFFFISLAFAVIGMNTEILISSLQVQIYIENSFTLSIIFLGGGFVFLMLVIGVIDSAARKLPIPEFNVHFENLEKTIKCKRNERIDLTLCIHNKGEDIAENLRVLVMFPPTFTIHETRKYAIAKQGAGTDNPNYNAACFPEDLLYIDTILSVSIALTPPDETRTYEIPIGIYERKIGLSKDKLTIQTTD